LSIPIIPEINPVSAETGGIEKVRGDVVVYGFLK